MRALAERPVTTPALRTARLEHVTELRPVAGTELAVTLLAEDLAQEAGLSPHDRITCPRHRRWLHQCVASPLHAIAAPRPADTAA